MFVSFTINEQQQHSAPTPLVIFSSLSDFLLRRGRNRIGRREKWPKTSWEEGEIREIKIGRGENANARSSQNCKDLGGVIIS